jgi:hypothetical protein
MKWSEDNSVLTDAQFGFRPGYGTHDAIFALHSIISKSLRQGKRLYCCLINSISISLTYMAYKNGDNDFPCTSPILQLNKSEKLPSCFTLDFNLEYIYLIRFKSFPVTPHLASYGTHDAIFALHSIISKSLRQGKRLYCCFIDYVKAFDSVSHFKLWLKLAKCGVTGKL